jgi:hypothetical protein
MNSLTTAQGRVPAVDLANTALPREVDLITRELTKAFAHPFPEGAASKLGQVKIAIYAFFDYDDEPIYVGQTRETVSTRVRRHLTGMRSDSVAKFVLDPFEVKTIKVWPLPHLLEMYPKEKNVPRSKADEKALKTALDSFESAVYFLVLNNSANGAVLNENALSVQDLEQELPEAISLNIVPPEVLADRGHADVRIARRAQTIANLARHISERKVSEGLRRVLGTQAERLSDLATGRRIALGISRGGIVRDVDGDLE